MSLLPEALNAMPAATTEARFELVIPTAGGEFIARYSPRGLAELSFPQPGPARRARPAVPHDLLQRISDWHRLTSKALKIILAGREPLDWPPLDVSAGTDFQRQVWAALQRIPRGGTASYGELARAIGRPRAFRAVGAACGANPIAVIIPCHRALAANGRLGGFSGGLEWKRNLLAVEGVRLVKG
jgi:methylated-DNA-[protein]-cysteine S-methyltransferase